MASTATNTTRLMGASRHHSAATQDDKHAHVQPQPHPQKKLAMSASDNAADILQSYFERSAAAVHHVFLRVEKNLNPIIGYLSNTFQTRPIQSSFLALFLSLSLLPTLSFIGFSLFVCGTFTFLALAGSFVASTFVVFLAGCILAFALAVLFLVAFTITSFVLAIFLAARLLVLVRTDGPRHGVSEWTKETKTRLYQGGTAIPPPSSPSEARAAIADSTVGDSSRYVEDDDDEDRFSNVSVGSTVVVSGETDTGAALGKDSPVLVEEHFAPRQ